MSLTNHYLYNLFLGITWCVHYTIYFCIMDIMRGISIEVLILPHLMATTNDFIRFNIHERKIRSFLKL